MSGGQEISSADGTKIYDICIIGGGIVGLAAAREYLSRHPQARLLLLEKESALGCHQSGHNSGVIHAGVYYKPGSLKAQLCALGSAETKRFCDEQDIPYATPGKLIVATTALEAERMAALKTNAERNGIHVECLDRSELRALEPEIEGLAALRIRASAVVDYKKVCRQLAHLVETAGGEIRCDTEVLLLRENADDVEVVSSGGILRARKLIACAGLQADRIADLLGLGAGFRIVPFRGEFFKIRKERQLKVSHMIYPTPDPRLPFLGIHLTPTVEGEMTVGPNAVLSLARESYNKFSVNLRDAWSAMAFGGFWKMAGAHWQTALDEYSSSFSKARYLEKCRKYCPSLGLDDLQPGRAGIRAQAISKSGSLIHDFLFLNSRRTLHLANAPSPAATAAMPIARIICDRIDG